MRQAFQKAAARGGPKQATGEHYTPRYIIDALGPFDTDPCSRAPRPFPTAATMIDPREANGLLVPWHGRVWLNPPFGGASKEWLGRLVAHGNGIALVGSRTEAVWWQRYAGLADLVCLHLRTIRFLRPDGSEPKNPLPGGIVYMAFGEHNAVRLRRAGLGVCARFDRGEAPASLQGALWPEETTPGGDTDE